MGRRSLFTRSELIPLSSRGEWVAALGVQASAFGNGVHVYVHSGTGIDAAYQSGTNTAPLATVEYAVANRVTANHGDVIWVMEGHNEGAGNAQIFDCDIAGISIVGLGTPSTNPIFDYDHANATIDVGANNCLLANFRLRPSVTGVLIGIDIETDVTGTVLKAITAINGEDGSGTDEFAKGIHLTSGNHDTVIEDCLLRSHTSAAGSTHGIHVDAASDRCVYRRVTIDGPWATNGILEDAASADTIVEDCHIDTTGTNYGFVSTSTYASFQRNTSADDRIVNRLGQEYYDGYGYKVTKTEDGATATSDALFTLTGKVNIKLWTGEVTNALGATAKFSDYKIELTTLAGVLIAAGDISSSIIGHMFTLNSDAGDTSLSTSTSAVSVAGVGDTQGKTGHLVVGIAGGSDVIKAPRTAGDAGDAIIHSVFYMPLEAGASLVAAA